MSRYTGRVSGYNGATVASDKLAGRHSIKKCHLDLRGTPGPRLHLGEICFTPVSGPTISHRKGEGASLAPVTFVNGRGFISFVFVIG
ncbi:hypothetical protein CEXT_10841 [Caerostris extrusa]|uniref:Uncharacterized protein n=1 Tax=Caerostris extrusa TaxID=172846 RepID=A0AAV4NSX3_CAEEX|nr:hypothetical protein CEXT_10841 [Caerostris extrusa]